MAGTVDLVLLACFFGDTEACLKVTGPAAASLEACRAAAPEIARLWSEANPGWEVVDWSCAPAPRDA